MGGGSILFRRTEVDKVGYSNLIASRGMDYII